MRESVYRALYLAIFFGGAAWQEISPPSAVARRDLASGAVANWSGLGNAPLERYSLCQGRSGANSLTRLTPDAIHSL
jgi:hypothetical protein